MRSRCSSLCSCTPTIWEHSTISGRQESTSQTGADYTTPRIDSSAHGYIGVRAEGARGAAAPPVSKIFGQNAKNSGNKETINDGIEK